MKEKMKSLHSTHPLHLSRVYIIISPSTSQNWKTIKRKDHRYHFTVIVIITNRPVSSPLSNGENNGKLVLGFGIGKAESRTVAVAMMGFCDVISYSLVWRWSIMTHSSGIIIAWQIYPIFLSQCPNPKKKTFFYFPKWNDIFSQTKYIVSLSKCKCKLNPRNQTT